MRRMGIQAALAGLCLGVAIMTGANIIDGLRAGKTPWVSAACVPVLLLSAWLNWSNFRRSYDDHAELHRLDGRIRGLRDAAKIVSEN